MQSLDERNKCLAVRRIVIFFFFVSLCVDGGLHRTFVAVALFLET